MAQQPNASPLNFLGDEQVKLPVGGDYPATGFIALWKASMLYSLRSEADWKGASQNGEVPYLARRKQSDKFKYYFLTHAEAKYAAEQSPEGKKDAFINQVWYFETAISNVLNVEAEHKEKFGDPMSYELQVNTLRSKKGRHEFHMLALPAAVTAVAHLLGYAVPSFSLAELLDPDAIFTDDFQKQMIGDPDSGDYESSVLWGRRAAIWTALGEKDAHTYNPIATSEVKPTKFDTKSEKLSTCLGIVARNWVQPAWLRLLPIPNPRVDAVTGEDRKRLNVPVIAEIFATPQAAAEAAQTELNSKAAASGNDAPKVSVSAPATVSSSVPANGKLPAIPGNWVGMDADWKASVIAVKGQYAGKPKPVIIAGLKAQNDTLVQAYAATAEEFIAWLDYV